MIKSDLKAERRAASIDADDQAKRYLSIHYHRTNKASTQAHLASVIWNMYSELATMTYVHDKRVADLVESVADYLRTYDYAPQSMRLTYGRAGKGRMTVTTNQGDCIAIGSGWECAKAVMARMPRARF